MANHENGSGTPHKGKPSGNGRENETLNEARQETQEENDLDTTESSVKHPNRHLHKGEELKPFKDTEE